ncbi:MAG: hypothetical protein JNJ54_24605 [Myxococcaceae bacterium]|nr:hypothetical protein [Myxococcaceae bacterium]
MADKRRFELFADLLLQRFPATRRVFDVAGGMGRLNEALVARGPSCLTFDRRHKHLPVEYAQRDFTLDEPCTADLVVGLHADGATRVIIEYSAKHQVPFAVVPCCSDNSMPYKPWMRHLADLAISLGLTVHELTLPMEGRARVLVGEPAPGRRLSS